MNHRVVFILWAFIAFMTSDLANADAGPEIPSGSDLSNFSVFQAHHTADPRIGLSSTQQEQILSDVQQHQFRHNLPQQSSQITFPNQPQAPTKSDLTPSFNSLAKYKVDRTKQTDRPFLQSSAAQYQFSGQANEFPSSPVSLNTFQTNLPTAVFRTSQEIPNFFNNPPDVNIQNYYEKQRELELLKRQREQLILEQHELRRQQEFLRLHQLNTLKSSTTTTTALPTTTQSPVLLASPTVRQITPSESALFLKAIANHQKKFTTTTLKPIIGASTTKPVEEKQEALPNISEDLLSLIQAQNPQLLSNRENKPHIKIIYQTEKPQIPRLTKTQSLEKDQLLRQLKLALAENSDKTERNVTTRDLILPNGRKLQIIQAPNGLSSIVPNEGSSQFQTVTQALSPSSTPPSTTVKPAKAILEELTGGVLPPGTDFEVLRHKDDGKLEDIGRTPIRSQPGKKVTFVVLEEQSDGSYKVQGVKGNSKEESDVDVESIVEKIKKGEIKLPPSSKSPVRESTISASKKTDNSTTIRPTTIKYTGIPSISKHRNGVTSADHSSYVTLTPKAVSQTDHYVTSASTPTANFYNSISTFNPTTTRISTTAARSISTTIQPPKNHFIPTMSPVREVTSSTLSPTFTTSYPPLSSAYIHFTSNPLSSTSSPVPRAISSTLATTLNNAGASENLIFNDFQGSNTETGSESTSSIFGQPETMANLLRREGLFAMAKYLRQSGLDSVLNETGPYTIFVPTDKAFRTLLVQLGGPEKAELKFRENPRLLSGLLLHHVIPGAFRIDSLQNEMTGVSLAGTQLRVNVYDMHDQEWNDVKVTTINGARIAPNKRDIEIPQGIAHAVDRVMFPLPVGDLTQTLAADREQRFGTFLRVLHASGLEDSLAGTKTFTVFAPTDAAFAAATSQSGRPVWTEADGPEVAKTIISRHIIPTTTYTAGMRFYHQKDTLRPQFTLKIQKNGGRVKVNEAQIITHNIPATNGVIHAIDSVL